MITLYLIGIFLFLHSSVPVCVVSISGQLQNFTYNPELIALDVPQYNNGKIRTAGIPQCATDIYLGYGASRIDSAFVIDEGSTYQGVAIKKVN